MVEKSGLQNNAQNIKLYKKGRKRQHPNKKYHHALSVGHVFAQKEHVTTVMVVTFIKGRAEL